MTLYTENGEEITLDISDNSELLEALTEQNTKLETIVESQSDVITALTAENEKLSEISDLVGLIFGALLLYGVYRFLSGVISSMFGGG